MNYKVPQEYFFRIHHIRPRFKTNVEGVLIFFSSEIAKLPELENREFADRVNDAVRRFPGNATKNIKTINNWRTEISSLFGFIQTGKNQDFSKPALRAIELEKNQDVVRAFKTFLYFFQYPGGHLKPQEISELIEAGVKFKPAQYVLRLLNHAEIVENRRVGISKAEFTHCVFNDLRCTRDNIDISLVWNRIKRNRENNVEYDTEGDVIRYAGDILDYMEIANLLISHQSGNYYINHLEQSAVTAFIESKEWFDRYDTMISHRRADNVAISELQRLWFDYVNKRIDDHQFSTDVIALTSENSEDYKEKLHNITVNYQENVDTKPSFGTKEIGDWGESLVYAHECERLKRLGRKDLIHLIKIMPTDQYLGYDLISLDFDERRRHIEVKSTISNAVMVFNRFHLTTNEWRAANEYRDKYFVYRLFISKAEKRLLVVNDPVGLYKNDQLQMIPRGDGADIIIAPDKVGKWEELLTWMD